MQNCYTLLQFITISLEIKQDRRKKQKRQFTFGKQEGQRGMGDRGYDQSLRQLQTSKRLLSLAHRLVMNANRLSATTNTRTHSRFSCDNQQPSSADYPRTGNLTEDHESTANENGQPVKTRPSGRNYSTNSAAGKITVTSSRLRDRKFVLATRLPSAKL